MLRLIGVFTNQKENFYNKLNMAIKVNDHVIPDWAIEGQAQSLFQSLAEKMAGNPPEVIQMAAIDLAERPSLSIRHSCQEKAKRGIIRWMR